MPTYATGRVIASSSVSNANLAFDGGSLSFRNKIINGAMRIDQRNNGAPSVWHTTAAAAASGFAVDRFRSSSIASSTWGTGVVTAQQSTDAPDEFDTSLKLTVTTADTALANTDVYAFVQPIEGNNIADLGFGTPSARPITLSFWVKSSIAGTYTVSFSNNAQTRSLVDTYTVDTPNTWEYKTVTINADTTGSWLTDSNCGLFVRWDLGSGSNIRTTNTDVWQDGLYIRTPASVNWISTSDATFFITGVQLEKGPVATPFENRPIGLELSLCQRYLNVINTNGLRCAIITTNYGNGGTPQFLITSNINMRVAPTIILNSGSWGTAYPGTGFTTRTAIYSTTVSQVVGGVLNFGAPATGEVISSGAILWAIAEL